MINSPDIPTKTQNYEVIGRERSFTDVSNYRMHVAKGSEHSPCAHQLSSRGPLCKPKFLIATYTYHMQKSADVSLAMAEEVMIPPHKGYHKCITGEEAKERLSRCKNLCYLTRYSKNRQCYILCVYQPQTLINKEEMMHFKISVTNKLYQLGGCQKAFADIEELLTYFEQNSFHPAFNTIGECWTEEKYQQAMDEEQRSRQLSEEASLRLQEIEMEEENLIEIIEIINHPNDKTSSANKWCCAVL